MIRSQLSSVSDGYIKSLLVQAWIDGQVVRFSGLSLRFSSIADYLCDLHVFLRVWVSAWLSVVSEYQSLNLDMYTTLYMVNVRGLS